jgi:spore germination protein D
MQEAMQNPLFRMEVLDLLKTVVQEELQPKVQKKEGSGGDSQKQEGGSGGDDSGS